MRLNQLLLLLCSPLLLAGVSRAGANPAPSDRPVIEIRDANFRPYPIAIAAARDTGESAADAAEAITRTLRFDFELSPVFKVLDPKSYLANPEKEGREDTGTAGINFSDWVSVGADGLIKAAVMAAGSSLRADMRFYDVGSGKELVKKTYAGGPDDARKFAHQFANAVVEHLTGTRGIFTTRIAAVKKTKTGREIFLFSVDGESIEQLTKNGSINLLPAWSKNGGDVLFTSYIRHNPNLYSMPATPGGRPKLVSGERGLNTGGTMSPDGKRIALTLSRDGNSEIYVVNADGTGLKRLTNEWAIDSSPTWSPDGQRIAFVSSRWGDPHIFVMNADGSSVRRITDRGTYNQTPDWSPRGDLIAFTARDERNKFDIFTVQPETKEIRRLTQDEGNNEEPSFSADGNNIVFTSTREGKSQVWIMAWDGSNQRRITQEGGYTTPAWSPYVD